MSAPEGQERAVDPQPTGGGAMSRSEAMEQFARIFDILNGLTGQTNQTSQSQSSSSAAGSGAGSSGSMGEQSLQFTSPSITTQAGSSHPATAPTFLQVVQQPPLISAPAQNLSAPGGASNVPTPASSKSPADILPAQKAVPAVSVSSALPPVPGYLVEKIQKGQFVDFGLLRPKNLKKLPAEEPSQAQLSKLMKSDLASISSFVDWAEAWAVYAGIVAKERPGQLQNLIAYFLLLATAHRDVQGLGWLEYDTAFRKQAVENTAMNWGEVLPTLWMTTVLSRGAQSGKEKDASKAKQLPCFKWNGNGCSFPRCRYAHVCSVCYGAHKKGDCSAPSVGISKDSGKKRESKEHSPSPLPKKKNYK